MNQYRIVTISREYGSGGREIGRRLAQELGMAFYDRELIALAAQNSGIAEEFFENAEKDRTIVTLASVVGGRYEPPLSDKVYFAQCDVIREMAQQGPCVLVGRCADHVLRSRDDVLNVFIYADPKLRAERAVQEYGDPPQKIEEHLRSIDKKRRSYYEYYTDEVYGRCQNYHLCLDSGELGIETAVRLIRTAYER